MKKCMAAKPHGYNVMHAKDLCHLVSNESFNKTAGCIKELIISDVTAKIMPPPMDCIGGIKKYCAPKNHPIILGWIDMFMVEMFNSKGSPKKMKDKSGNSMEAEWNVFAVVKRYFDGKCKAETKFASKFKMPTA